MRDSAGSGDAHPHAAGGVLVLGPNPDRAAAGLVLVHGRGGSARDIASLGPHLGADDAAVRAPQARGGSWYPMSFLAPRAANEPGLSSGLRALAEVVADLETSGLPRERIVLAGFSQGACLALEFAARHGAGLGGVAAFSGGLIGPAVTRADYAARLDGVPFFLGSSDPDPHVPWSRVEESAGILRDLGASVDARRYPAMGHTINEDELAAARDLVRGAIARGRPSSAGVE